MQSRIKIYLRFNGASITPLSPYEYDHIITHDTYDSFTEQIRNLRPDGNILSVSQNRSAIDRTNYPSMNTDHVVLALFAIHSTEDTTGRKKPGVVNSSLLRALECLHARISTLERRI